ncbi:hypothetical protein [Actinosynnema mirum]|uniref:hypothetical protein n=1 Tax=Actinosynnema mirum TaxID=40567 RepID=UPI00019AB3A4|nr:hypothetical protein [Actinosynnema mirum]
MKVFGREPAYWLALVSSVVAFVSAAVLPLSVEQQGVLNAAAAALFGVLTAWTLAGERLVAALVGLGKALVAAGLAFGLALAPEVQSTLMVLVELVLTGLLVRPAVIAPVPSSTVPPGVVELLDRPRTLKE